MTEKMADQATIAVRTVQVLDESDVTDFGRVNYVRVSERSDGQRLDNFLLRILKGVPKSHVYRIVRNGEVRINRKRAECQTKLAIGDEIRIPPVRTAVLEVSSTPAVKPLADTELPILHEDRDLIIVITDHHALFRDHDRPLEDRRALLHDVHQR